MATPSREVAQTLASTTSKRGLDREAQAALCWVQMGPEYPEGNLRELMWDSNPKSGLARERERENLRHCQPALRTKDCWLRTGPSPARGREACGGQPELERGNLGPRDSILYQTAISAIRLPVTNQDLGFWMVDICWEGQQPEISSPEETHSTPEKAHLLYTQKTEQLGQGRW